MNTKSRPENLELASIPQPLHLVSSEPVLCGKGATTPTIKLSSAFEYPSRIGDVGTVKASPVILSAHQQSHDSKLGFSTLQGRENSDLFPSDQNGNADLSTSEAPEKLSVISSSTNCQSPLKTSLSSSITSSGNSGLLSVLPIKTRFATLSISDSLMPPEAIAYNSKRHNSLPIPGVINLLTPAHAHDYGKINGKKHSNGSISVSQPSSPVHTAHTEKQSPWARMFGKKEPKVSTVSGYSSTGEMSDASCFSINSQDEEQLGVSPKQRLQSLVKTVRTKMKKVGNNQVAPAPQTLLAPPQPAISTRKRLDSFAPSSVATDEIAEQIHFKGIPCCHQEFYMGALRKILLPKAIDPLGNGWLSWLFVVALAYMYNAIVILLRCSFPVQTMYNFHIWFCFDYLFDTIYIMDIFLRMRLIYFDCGMVVMEPPSMRKEYLKSKNCKMDMLSLLPLDLFYFMTGFYSDPNYGIEGAASASILLRLPRLIKIHSYVEFVEKFENRTTYPNIFRVVQSVGYLLYLIHLNTCCYYLVSVWEGFDTNEWVFSHSYNNTAYVFCLYRAAKTLITIGNLPKPQTDFEVLFMNVDFLIGIFVFASIIGQMRDIVGNAGATRGAFRRRMDNTMALLKHWKIPNDIQNRVRLWYMYSWDRKELVDELEAIKGVPIKMQTDLAIHVHMGTLSKVSLFQDCDKMLLRDLVLKLRPVLYLPGDYICRKGEVGKEMYIIKSGCVQVLGGENNRTVLATLHSGSYFGEISLLSVGVGNRRTADVYSPGYANIFLLDKKTLQEVVVNYPDAQESLKKKAREILKKNQASESQNKKRRGKSLIAESILKINGKERNPSKFFSTVLAAARNQKISSTILKGSFRNSMGSEGSLAKFSASDFSSDDELLNNPPRKRKFKRKKSRRRSKSATPQSTNVDVHALDDSDALSAVEKGAFDNKGYLSTDASFSVDETKLPKQSTEEAIADILTDSETKQGTGDCEKKDKKPMLQKQICVDETEINDMGNKARKPTPLEEFSFDDTGWSSRDEDKSDGLLSGRQFTFDERDEEADMSHPLRQFTFDEMDEMIREENENKVPPLKQFTFDEMDELEDEEEIYSIPPLRQFTFDDSEDSETEIEHHIRRLSSKDSARPSQTDLNEPTKEAEEESDSPSSKEGGQEENEKRTSKPKISNPHAERIRARQRRGRVAKSRKGSVKSLRSKKDSLGKKSMRKFKSMDESRDADETDLSLSLSFDTDDDKKEQDSSDADKSDSKPRRRIGMIRRLPPISLDTLPSDSDEDKDQGDSKEQDDEGETDQNKNK